MRLNKNNLPMSHGLTHLQGNHGIPACKTNHLNNGQTG